ncbi:MAG: Mut7-C RNAse domain-containing protein [Nitrosopumilaceae archaeon]
MLGNIAKKLRLMGYDVRYWADIKDEDLIKQAKKEKRTIISRDQNLVRRGEKNGIKSNFLKNQIEIDQLREIIIKSNLKLIKINGDIARCPICNSKTHSLLKKNIQKNIPEKILEYNEKFWECKTCEKIFWEGTHIKNLQKMVDELNVKRN